MPNNRISRSTAAAALAAALAVGLLAATPVPTSAAPVTSQPTQTVTLSVGQGQLVRLSGAMTDLFVANDAVADVQVRSPTQLYVFGKGAGTTTVYATNRAGEVVYSSNIRVGSNLSSVGDMLHLAMPEARIAATPMNGLILLTGTVTSPGDIEQANQLVQAFVGADTKVMSRLQTATPLQVNLHVKIAEVSRALSRQIGINLLSRDTTGGFLFGVAQGRNFGSIGDVDISGLPKLDASSIFGLPAGSLQLPFDPSSGQFVTSGGTLFDLDNLGQGAGVTNLSFAGKLFGLDFASALDLAETDGLVTTLAEPNLTALSGETASFLAGGEVPIPLAQGLGTVSVEYKQYGVSLAFTPTVLSDGRISLRVRPEVSELSDAGAVRLSDFTIPAFTTRRAETTVELGSGQSFMIGGLLSNGNNSAVDKAPFLGDLPIIGSLFRSSSFRRNETELVIIVTPYLVRPVSANQIALPTDGYRAPTQTQQLLHGSNYQGRSGARRPVPSATAPVTVGANATPAPANATPAAAPGFSNN